MFVSWISSLETKRKMPNSCPSLVFLRFLQTAGDEEDEVLSNSCSNKLGSKTQPQMAAVPQAKSKPYHWLCLGTWRRQHLTLEKSTYQYLIMILLFYVLSIWWNLMEVIWNLFFTSFYDSSIYCSVYHCLVWFMYLMYLMCLVKAWSLPCFVPLSSSLMLQCSSRVTRDRSKISGKDWVDCGKRCKGIWSLDAPKATKKIWILKHVEAPNGSVPF